ncbi:MAG: hypothetical protein Q9205_002054 [Flavoplaca limonia]
MIYRGPSSALFGPRPRIRAPFRAARLKIFVIERCCTSSGQTRGCYSLVAGAAVASNNGLVLRVWRKKDRHAPPQPPEV